MCMKKKLPKSTFNKSITMETEHALINFFLPERYCNQCVPEEGHQAETSEINIVSNIWSWFLTKTK